MYNYEDLLNQFKEHLRNKLYPDITECCNHDNTFMYIDYEGELKGDPAPCIMMMHVCKHCTLCLEYLIISPLEQEN